MWYDLGGAEKENIFRHSYKLTSQRKEGEKRKQISIITAGLLIIGTKPDSIVGEGMDRDQLSCYFNA